MAAIREVVVGGVAGHMVMAVAAKMIADTRQLVLEEMLRYQHKAADLEEVPFVAVYSASSRDEGTAARTSRSLAARPETGLHYWSVERVIIQSDDNPDERPNSTRRVVGLVIMRHPDAGPFRCPSRDDVRRFKVELEYGYASNGNTYRFNETVTEFKPANPEDIELSRQIEG